MNNNRIITSDIIVKTPLDWEKNKKYLFKKNKNNNSNNNENKQYHVKAQLKTFFIWMVSS